MEAITGAAALVKSLKCEGRDNVSTLLLNWTGTPGHLDLPQEGTLRVGPYGDYEARLEGADKPFASGLIQDTLMRPATIRTGTTIRITDQDVFRDAMGIEDEAPLTEADLRSAMIRLPVDPQEAGIARITVSDLRVEADRVYFELVTEVSDMRSLVRASRNAYLAAWWDNTWLPASPAEALFELALGSNANPSPNEMGFEILEYPETRSAAILGSFADREVSSSPDLIPEGHTPYADWLELTGRDDSFVGNGHDVPGTRDLYRAVIRALPVPDRSGPEPD
jgi:hypothetical protein